MQLAEKRMAWFICAHAFLQNCAGWPDEFWGKIAQNVAHSIFCRNQYVCMYMNFPWKRVAQNFVIFKRTGQSKQSPNRRKFAQSGRPEGVCAYFTCKALALIDSLQCFSRDILTSEFFPLCSYQVLVSQHDQIVWKCGNFYPELFKLTPNSDIFSEILKNNNLSSITGKLGLRFKSGWLRLLFTNISRRTAFSWDVDCHQYSIILCTFVNTF
jgi:hypothetical protein